MLECKYSFQQKHCGPICIQVGCATSLPCLIGDAWSVSCQVRLSLPSVRWSHGYPSHCDHFFAMPCTLVAGPDEHGEASDPVLNGLHPFNCFLAGHVRKFQSSNKVSEGIEELLIGRSGSIK